MSASALFMVLSEVVGERANQDEQFGEQNHPDHGKVTAGDLLMAQSETRRVRHLCDKDVKAGTVNWTNILQEEFCEAIEEAYQGNEEALRVELLQVAAVAVAWIQAIDRRQEQTEQAIDRRQEQTEQIDLTQLMLPF